MKTSELNGAALDWAVAKCEGRKPTIERGMVWVRADKGQYKGFKHYTPSTDWAQGGPIIERELIDLRHIRTLPTMFWEAYTAAPERDEGEIDQQGPTPLIAAMRCYVASKLGDDVEVPAELLTA